MITPDPHTRESRTLTTVAKRGPVHEQRSPAKRGFPVTVQRLVSITRFGFLRGESCGYGSVRGGGDL